RRKTAAAARQRALGHTRSRKRAGIGWRMVCRLPAGTPAQLRTALPGDLRPRPAAPGLARLRRGSTCRSAGEWRRRALLAAGDPPPERVYRSRRTVSLYARRFGPAWSRGTRGRARGRSRRQPGAAQLSRSRLLSRTYLWQEYIRDGEMLHIGAPVPISG